MKKLVCILFLSIFICAHMVGCANKEINSDTLLLVNERGYIVIGVDDSFPPMGFIDKDSGEIIGFDIDVSRAVCERLGVEARYQPIDWVTKESELANGNIDCIWNGMSKTYDLERVMNLSMPYMQNNQCILVREDSDFRTIDDLYGKTIAVQSESSAEHAMDKNQDLSGMFKNIIAVDTYTKAILEINNKTVDAIAIDEIVARYYMNNFGGMYRFIEDGEGNMLSLSKEDYVIGFRKNDDNLRSKIEEILVSMAEDGSLKKISEKWFSEDITTINK